MQKEGLETKNNFIKIFICFFVYLLDEIGKLKLQDYNNIYITMQSTRPIKIHNFLATVPTNKLVILTIIFAVIFKQPL